MAGAGYKLFNTGDVLTAAQVNTYLQEQVVMVFANATARTSALSGVLAEGMVTYLKDTDALEIYSGAAWVGYGSGDITGITTGATSGLTGGVTSGTADLKLNTTAKGGLLVGTGSGTVTELAVGTANQSIIVDSATTSGLKYAASPQSLMTATGDVIYASSANTPARLGIGTTGQILTVSGGIPSWATPSSSASGLTFISRTALSGASTYNFTDVFTSTYETYLIILSRLAATTFSHTTRLRMRYGSTTDDGAGQYYQGGYVNTYQSTNSNLSVSGGSYWELNDQTGDGQFARNTIWIDGVGTGSNTRAIYTNNGKTGGNQANVVSSGSCGETARNYTGFTIYTSGGSNLSGTVTIYGLAKA